MEHLHGAASEVHQGQALSWWNRLYQYFSEADFMPHGHCYLWKPGLVWTHVISDFLIGLAYISISITLYGLVKKTKLGFSTVVLCFGVFIGACGLTHFNEIWNLWFSDYWYSGGVKLLTAAASVGTGIYLFKLRHPIVMVAEAAKLSEQRRLDLEALTEDLERRVEERTKTLMETEQEMRLAQEVAKVGTFKWDIIHNINAWSPELEKLYGIPIGSFGGTIEEWRKLVHPNDLLSAEESLSAAMERGSFEAEWRVVWPSGEVHWLAGRGKVEKDAFGKPLRMIGINIDITKEKNFVSEQEEVLKRLNAAVIARDEFLSIASHELKTPLTSLSLQTQTMKRSIVKDDPTVYSKVRVDRLVEQNEKHVERLTRLVNDMLDIARIRTGNLSLEFEEFNFCEVVEEVRDRLSPQLAQGKIDLNVSKCVEAIGKWDRFRIEQVLMNLLTNAIKYGAGKPIDLIVSREATRVKVSVQDRGIGISREDHERVFERFERAVSANEVSGLGLGLFISQEIIKAHHGRMWLESEPGKGSIFHFDLPLETRG